jgi:gp16 family phage-associated protein
MGKPNELGVSANEVKAHFVRNGTTMNQWRKPLGVSHALVSQLIHGKRPGRSGRSLKIWQALRKELGK